MIKNVALKNLLTNTVFRGISAASAAMPKWDDMILIYCNMGFRDNVKYIYDYLIEHGYNRKYRIIRSQNEPYEGEVPRNVRIVSNAEAIRYFCRAGHVFYSFGRLPIMPGKGQVTIQTGHGQPFKGYDEAVRTNRRHNEYTYAVAASEFFRGPVQGLFNVDPDHVCICGLPRTDAMYSEEPPYETGLSCQKTILWMPTFRKSALMGYTDVQGEASLVPLFSNEELKALNDRLKETGIGLLIKLHPSQDLDGYEALDLSNIRLLSHAAFNAQGWDLYRLMGQVDGLITDYSSVFIDYLLMDRPLAFTMDDFEDYKETRGFCVPEPESLMAGHKIRTAEDFLAFIEDMAAGRDPWQEERRRVRDLLNACQDGQNTRRLLRISGIYLTEEEREACRAERARQEAAAEAAMAAAPGEAAEAEAAEGTGEEEGSGQAAEPASPREASGEAGHGRLLTAAEQRKVMFEMLCYLDDLCREHDIHYSLVGGTLLGAVRHKGFIPWDDDIDIFLLRPEYDRLDALLRKETRYRWVTADTDPGYFYNYGRLVNPHTVVYDDELEDLKGMGIFIDVCVVDGLPDNRILREAHIARMRALYRLRRSTTAQKEAYVPKNPVKRALKGAVRSYTLARGAAHWAEEIGRLDKRYPVEGGRYVCNLTCVPGRKEMLERSCFDSYITMEFEGRDFMVMRGWEDWLTQVYGNYMELPPLEKRVSHHYDRAFWLEGQEDLY